MTYFTACIRQKRNYQQKRHFFRIAKFWREFQLERNKCHFNSTFAELGKTISVLIYRLETRRNLSHWPIWGCNHEAHCLSFRHEVSQISAEQLNKHRFDAAFKAVTEQCGNLIQHACVLVARISSVSVVSSERGYSSNGITLSNSFFSNT